MPGIEVPSFWMDIVLAVLSVNLCGWKYNQSSGGALPQSRINRGICVTGIRGLDRPDTDVCDEIWGEPLWKR